MLKDIPTSRLEEIVTKVDNGEAVDVSKDTVKRYRTELAKRQATQAVDRLASLFQTENEIQTTIISQDRFTTVEQMAKFCNIDLDVWIADRIVTNEWGSQDNPSWQFKVTWKKNTEITLEFVTKKLEERCKDYELPKFPKYESAVGNVALEVQIPDLHLGRLAWKHETGASYDVKIAYNEWMKAHQYFYDTHKHLDIDTVVIIGGSDYFNSDNENNTTSHGTVQSEDGRWQRSFSVGCDAMEQAIELWRSKGYKVIVKMVRGNHDNQRSFYLGHYLTALYRNVDDVEIDNEPTLRKYWVYGRNMVLFAHGQSDYKRLRTVYQSEMREYLSQCDCIEAHVGHTHNEKVVEDFGSIILRTVPSLAQKSAWETECGYTGNRRAQSFVWHKKKGLLSIDYYTPDFLDR